MKKLLRNLCVSACLLMIMFASVLVTACGGSKAYSVAGLTFKGTSQFEIVWGEATQAEKEEFWSELDVTSDAEFTERYAELAEGFYETWTFVYNEDGTFSITLTEHEEPETYTGYYQQSQDLKEVLAYEDAEHTELRGEFTVKFINGNFCLKISDAEYDVEVFVVIEQE